MAWILKKTVTKLWNTNSTANEVENRNVKERACIRKIFTIKNLRGLRALEDRLEVVKNHTSKVLSRWSAGFTQFLQSSANTKPANVKESLCIFILFPGGT